MVSIIIPARKERLLNKTIREVQEKAQGEIEIIVVLDGADDKRLDGVKYIYHPEAKGMRTSIREGVEMATGKYVMKLDAHCMVDSGFDVKLSSVHQPNWVQIPRRYRLDYKNWKIDESYPPIDYMYLDSRLIGIRNRGANNDPAKKEILLDDTDSFQGSCFFAEKDYYKKLNLSDSTEFGEFAQEAQEIAFKVWIDGGRVIRNKNTWYAHARMGRKYSTKDLFVERSREAIQKYYKEHGSRTNKNTSV